MSGAVALDDRHPRADANGPGPIRRPASPPRAALLAALVLAALSRLLVGAAFAGEPDTSRSRPSDGGAFVVTIESRVEPVPLNALHSWEIHVETADGEPVEGATFDVDGGMPMHDHGLPTAPRVTEELGGGNYLLEGVRFQMPGHWVVSFAISGAGAEDSVTFELML